MNISDPQEGRVSGLVSKVSSDILEELNRDVSSKNPTFEEQIDMLRFSVLGTIAETSSLIASLGFGTFVHPDEEIENWVNSNLDHINLPVAVTKQFSAKFFQNAVSEWSVSTEIVEGEWRLDTLAALHPSDYSFRVKNRQLYDVLDTSTGEELPIPVERCLITINGEFLAFGNPTRGTSDCIKAWSSHRAWKLVMSELLIAGQRQALPLLWGQADSQDQVYLVNSDGTPLLRNGQRVAVNAAKHLQDQLTNIGNRKVLTTGLKEKIQAINYQTDGKFLIELATYFERLQMMSFSYPETIFKVGESGLGNSGLNEGHMEILNLSIEGINSQIRREVMIKIITPLIFWNFGEQETYGEIKPPEKDNLDKIRLLEILVNAISKGVFSPEDMGVVNRSRELAGIPKIVDGNKQMTPQKLLSYVLNTDKYWEEEHEQ